MASCEAFSATSLKLNESVRMYVMKPASYSLWATIIVCATEKPSLRAASCCSVEVVKGGAGDFLSGRFVVSSIVKVVVGFWQT